MSEVNALKQQVAREAISRREVMETKKQDELVDKKLSRIKKDNEKLIETAKKDYQVQLNNDKSEYDEKLTKIREMQSQRLMDEEKRFEDTLTQLKSSHAAKMAELKETHENDIQREIDSQNNYMENARRKFKEEKRKIEA